MRFRKLRIAWSAFCGVACVLLILFWVRSYWWVEGVTIPLSTKHSFVIGSAVETFVIGLDTPSESLSFVQRSVEDWKHDDRNPSPIWGGIIREQGRFVVLIPDWFLAILTAAACIVLGYRQLEWRFSLRTLLIATTLVAVALGLAVYAAKKVKQSRPSGGLFHAR